MSDGDRRHVRDDGRAGKRSDPATSISLPLSGTVPTDRLPVVAGEPVTITVARSVRPGLEAQFLRWQSEVVAAVLEAPGCLGATVLHPGPEGGSYQTIFRFADGTALRNWERSDERAALMVAGEPFVLAERLTRTVGVETFFQLPTHVEPKRPLWRRVAGDLAWVYPLSIVMSLVIAPLLLKLSLWERVLVTSVLFGVVMRIAVGPMRRRLRNKMAFREPPLTALGSQVTQIGSQVVRYVDDHLPGDVLGKREPR